MLGMGQASTMIDPSSGFDADLGADGTYGVGSAFGVTSLLTSERYLELDRKQSFFECRQHDFKRYDFEGRMISTAGVHMAAQPLLTGESAPWYVPLKDRRPSSPARIGRVIVRSFTDMIFGDGRFPKVAVDGAPDTQDFVTALVKAAKLPIKMVRARDLGGAVGSVGISWCFSNGKPKVRIHNAKNLFVHAWEDAEDLIPRHVSEVYMYDKDEYDHVERRVVKRWYLCRKDFTPKADIAFFDCPFDQKSEPIWVPNLAETVQHNDGICHMLWIQNTPNESSIDGDEDYMGLYDKMEEIDVISSTIGKGTKLNLDPTVLMKMDPDLLPSSGVRKGSDNALYVGETGDAHYMEMSGSGISVGLNVYKMKRDALFEEAACVKPDPNTVAAQGTSSVAMKMMYAPMLARCDVLREQYGSAVERILTVMLSVARARFNPRAMVDGSLERQVIMLPMRVEEQPDGSYLRVERTPGVGGDLEVKWPPYFAPTALDKQAEGNGIVMATGGKPVMSHQSGVEAFADLSGNDSATEWQRVQAQEAERAQSEMGMFADTNGAMGGRVAPTGLVESAPVEDDDFGPDDGDAEPLAGDKLVEAQ